MFRDWLETHAPRLMGVLDWPRYRLCNRCFACGRLMVAHTPWALYICERTPLPIRITEQGMARIAEAEARAAEPAQVA
jgi:hypothetical protein